MSRRSKLAGRFLLVAAGGGVAAVQYARTTGHEGGEVCCLAGLQAGGDPNAARPLIELEGDDKKQADA